MFGSTAYAQVAFASPAGVIYAETQSEATTPSATVANTLVAVASLSASVTPTASQSASAAFVAVRTETATPSTTQTLTAVYNTSVVETAAATATVTNIATLVASIYQASTPGDAYANSLVAVAALMASVAANDAYGNTLDAVAATTASAATGDAYVPSFTYNVTQAESSLSSTAQTNTAVLLADQAEVAAPSFTLSYTLGTDVDVTGVVVAIEIGSPLVWGMVNDDQSPGWTDVIRAQRIDSVASFGAMGFGDLSIAGQYKNAWTPQPENWTQVDDDQTPDWQWVQN